MLTCCGSPRKLKSFQKWRKESFSFFQKVYKEDCQPSALENGGHMDPRTPCHILCPPVSETHRGGSTDVEKGSQPKRPQEPGGKEISKGDGEDQGPWRGPAAPVGGRGKEGGPVHDALSCVSFSPCSFTFIMKLFSSSSLSVSFLHFNTTT